VLFMKKLWALLFLLVPIGGVWSFAISPGRGWWMPPHISSYGPGIDRLFYIILAITGVTFVLTQGALVLFLFRYAGDAGRKGTYIHGHHKTEVVWTVVPALILVFIAFAQMDDWKMVKFKGEFPNAPPLAEMTAGQFEWRIRYAGADGKLNTADDVHVLNDFHVPAGKPVVFHLKSRDVLHSFFVRELRLKQDAVPGMTIPMWFDAAHPGGDAPAYYDLMCAELCGWGHYKMRGRLTVHPSAAAFDAWLARAKREQDAAEPEVSAKP
jgi:cytochrome c oxidase subunit 2